MISSPTDSGSVPTQQPTWWLESWKAYVCAALSLLECLCGVITAISISPLCVIGGIFQIIAGIIVLAVETPTIVAFLRFAQPIGIFFDGKPVFIKIALYAVIAIIPVLMCAAIFSILGLLAGLGNAAVYGLIFLGPKASRDAMKFQAGGGMASNTAPPPYSPTSP